MSHTEEDLRSAYTSPLDPRALSRLALVVDQLVVDSDSSAGRRRMTRKSWLAASITALVVVLITVGTALVIDAHHKTHGAAPAPTSSDRALQLWAGFPILASPRPVVLTGPAVIDPSTGFANGDDKLAYGSGRFDVAVSLPTGPSGQLMTAADALKVLQNGGDDHGTTSLRITAISLGTGTFSTDRGPQNLPTWIFAFAGVAQPAKVLAIPTGARWPQLGMPSSRSSFETEAKIAADGSEVTISFIGASAGAGPCDAEYTADVKEAATAVEVSVRQLPKPDPKGAACAAIGFTRSVTVTLTQPVGNRVLVDSNGAAIAGG